MSKIKRYQEAYTISRQLYKELNSPEQVEQLIKRQLIQRLSEQLYNNLEYDFYESFDPFVSYTHTVDIVAMPTSNWNKIGRFLTRNNFDFNEL